MAWTPGAQLGPYEIIAPSGAGGMGEVYRARDPQLGREDAIKILPSFKTQKWSDILTSPDKFVNWLTSPDGKYFHYSTGGRRPHGLSAQVDG
jgi:serine/threonine protein kinase